MECSNLAGQRAWPSYPSLQAERPIAPASPSSRTQRSLHYPDATNGTAIGLPISWGGLRGQLIGGSPMGHVWVRLAPSSAVAGQSRSHHLRRPCPFDRTNAKRSCENMTRCHLLRSQAPRSDRTGSTFGLTHVISHARCKWMAMPWSLERLLSPRSPDPVPASM